MDGITRPSYPDWGAWMAARLAAQSVTHGFSIRCESWEDAEARVRCAFEHANNSVKVLNERRGASSPDYSSGEDFCGTVGCVLWVPAGCAFAVCGWIGDCLVFHLPHDGEPQLLTRNQLAEWNAAYHDVFFGGESIGEDSLGSENMRRLAWQREYVRNRCDAHLPDGTSIEGFGALTGEPNALDFVEVQCVPIALGDRFVLASDAIRVLENDGGEESLLSVLAALRALSRKEMVDQLIHAIREADKAKGVRLDDVTVAVADMEDA